MLRLPIKYIVLGTLLMALIASPGLSKAFAMGGGGGTGYGAAGNPSSYKNYGTAGNPYAVPSSSFYQNRLSTNMFRKSHKTRRQNSF